MDVQQSHNVVAKRCETVDDALALVRRHHGHEGFLAEEQAEDLRVVVEQLVDRSRCLLEVVPCSIVLQMVFDLLGSLLGFFGLSVPSQAYMELFFVMMKGVLC